MSAIVEWMGDVGRIAVTIAIVGIGFKMLGNAFKGRFDIL